MHVEAIVGSNGPKVGDVVEIACQAVNGCIRLRDNHELKKKGGLLAILARKDGMTQDINGLKSQIVGLEQNIGNLQLLVKIGEIPYNKESKYRWLALEKARRTLILGHRSSWESRDETKKQYGGGVVGGDYGLGFSGLTEKEDEAVVLTVAAATHFMSWHEARRIAEVSGNEKFFMRLWTELGL